MFICALGDIENKGEISMTARGTYNQEGENVYLWKNIDDTYEYVPAEGAAGGVIVDKNVPGENAEGRQTGGGGSGAVEIAYGGRGGSGAAGTSYSGGSGGGGATRTIGGVAGANGGAGGNGRSLE